MKKFKKVGAIILSLIMLMALVSCGQTSNIKIKNDGTASISVEIVYDKAVFDEKVSEIKGGKDYVISGDFKLTSENVDSYVDDFKSYYEVKEVNGKECYYFGFNKEYENLKSLERGFYSDGLTDSEIPITFSKVNINNKDAFFFNDNFEDLLTIPEEVRTLTISLPYKIVQTNGEKLNDNEVKFNLLDGVPCKYYVCEGSSFENLSENEILEHYKKENLSSNKPSKINNLLLRYDGKTNTITLSYSLISSSNYDEKSFEVQRKINNGSWKTISTTKDGLFKEKVAGGKTYSYKVRAKIKYLDEYVYGEYSDTKTVKTMNFKQKPVIKNAKAGKRSVFVKLKSKIKNADGYQFKLALNKKMTKNQKSKTSNTTNATFKKLKAKTKYYVKVRAYKFIDGEKIYGAWSKVKVSNKTK